VTRSPARSSSRRTASARRSSTRWVRIDTVNGADPDAAKHRQDFSKLTPLYATERLRLETESNILITRIADIVTPIGKGQRGLIVSPAQGGKTLVLQALANAITTNNPEVHLMVVLVDERPEEVTDMQRTVKGRGHRLHLRPTGRRPHHGRRTRDRAGQALVELGHDVVVLLDSITRSGGPTTSPPRPVAGSSPVVSTPRRCTRPSGSSARPATSRTAAR
jgi:transcription termination factor Rho